MVLCFWAFLWLTNRVRFFRAPGRVNFIGVFFVFFVGFVLCFWAFLWLTNRVRTFRAPGRVNLIGEHTDYNDGFVMPAALDFSTWVYLSPLEQRRLRLHSENFNEEVEVDLDDQNLAARGHWSDYPIGVAVTLERAGYRLRGASLRIRGDVPSGSGLSSSAAIEVATACALTANSDIKIDARELALLCQRAEIEYVGLCVGFLVLFVF